MYVWIQLRHLKNRCAVSTQPKDKILKSYFADLLKCVVDCINHSYMYFVCTDTVETIVRVDMVSSASKKRKGFKNIFADLLTRVVDRINCIHIYFGCMNTVKIFLREGVVSPPNKKEIMLKKVLLAH